MYSIHYCMTNFRIKKRKENILHQHSQNKYLFKHFYLSCFNPTQFAEFASLKIKMHITFAKSLNVLNSTTLYPECDQVSNLWQQLELASELESDL